MLDTDYVTEFYKKLAEKKIKIWLDGGWGVDALLGKVTRYHEDLDIVVAQKDLLWLTSWLQEQGFKNVPRDDTSDWNFVMGDKEKHLIDIHAVVFDAEGNGLYGPKKNGIMYPAASLTGTGIIKDQIVRCISPEYVIKFHSGYELDENDFKDVAAIKKKFSLS